MKLLIGYVHAVLSNLLLYVFGILYTALITLFSFIAVVLKWRWMLVMIPRAWGLLLFILALRPVKIKGKEKVDFSRPYLILANHASMFDIPLLYKVYPKKIQWISKQSIFSIPLWGIILRNMGCIPMEREKIKSAKSSLENAIKQDMGASIAMFPEGTRTSDGKIQRFKRGFIYIFRHTEYDILPVTFNGLFRFAPKPRLLVDPRCPLEVVFHEPLKREELVHKTDDEIMDIARQHIEKDYREDTC